MVATGVIQRCLKGREDSVRRRLAAALLVLGAKAGLGRKEITEQFPRIGEFPFSSYRKRMTTIHRTEDEKIRAVVKGAPEVVLERCSYFLNGDQIAPLDDTQRERILKANEEMANDALRVLGISYRELS